MTARSALIAVAVLMLTVATPVAATGKPISGRELLTLCTNDTGEATVSNACASHFRAVLDALRSGGRIARSAAQCMPEDVSLHSLVARYVSESERFPEVLHVPARTLIVGMVVKFYHCRSARWISLEPDLDNEIAVQNLATATISLEGSFLLSLPVPPLLTKGRGREADRL